MRISRALLFPVLALAVLTAAAEASPVPLPLVPADFASVSGLATPLTALQVTPMAQDALQTEVISQAFQVDTDSYLYLYQVCNVAPINGAVVEIFSFAPFAGASGTTVAGYLTDGVPAGFFAGDRAPVGASCNLLSGPTLSFGFPAWTGESLEPGQRSLPFYVLSDVAPGTIVGNVINGEIASGPVVGAVPEPTTALLLLAGLGLMRRRIV